MLGFLHQFIYSVHCLGFKWTLSNKIFWWDKGMPSQTENVIEVYVAVIFNGFKIQSWKCSIQGQRFRGKGGTPECTLCRRENKPTPSGVGCLQGTMPWVFRLAPLPLSRRLPGQAALVCTWGSCSFLRLGKTTQKQHGCWGWAQVSGQAVPSSSVVPSRKRHTGVQEQLLIHLLLLTISVEISSVSQHGRLSRRFRALALM